MKLNLKNPVIFFDLETTGINIITDRIVEISYLKVHTNGNEESKTLRINPERHIPEESSAIHGIYDEDVKDCPKFKEVAQMVQASTPTDSMCPCSWRNSYAQESILTSPGASLSMCRLFSIRWSNAPSRQPTSSTVARI